MKVHLRRQVMYSDVDEQFYVTLPAIFQLFQDVSAHHSELIGYGIEKLSQECLSWVLSKLNIVVYRYVKYGEVLEIQSWSRGAAGFKMLRDFQIFSGSELVAAGSSVWFFVNMKLKKVERVPREIDKGYQGETKLALESGIESWAFYEKFTPDYVYSIGTRLTELDPTRHINNTHYCEYVLHALAKWRTQVKKIAAIKFQFSKEIGKDVEKVDIGFTSKDDSTVLFKIFTEHELFSRGEILF